MSINSTTKNDIKEAIDLDIVASDVCGTIKSVERKINSIISLGQSLSEESKALVEAIDREFAPGLDKYIDGTKTPSFKEWLCSVDIQISINPETLEGIYKGIYNTYIYNTPTPHNFDLDNYILSYEGKIAEIRKKHSSIDFEKLIKMDEDTYFDPSIGELFHKNKDGAEYLVHQLDMIKRNLIGK